MVKLGSTLESSRKDKRLANSDNIYDKKLGKMQEKINQEVSSLSPVDEEDLTRSYNDNGRSVTKFADRSYSPQNFSGKGYKILRKNIKPVSLAVTKIIVSSVPTSDGYISFIINGVESHVDVVASSDTTTDKVADKIAAKLTETMTEYEVSKEASTVTLTRKFGGAISTPSSFSAVNTGVSCSITDSTKKEIRNILTPIMMSQPNTIYEVRYDFDLNGETIEMQEECTLKFEGGTIKNGKLIYNNTYIKSQNTNIYHDVIVQGTIKNKIAYSDWFGTKKDGVNDDSTALQNFFNCGVNKLIVTQGAYKINKGLSLPASSDIDFSFAVLYPASGVTCLGYYGTSNGIHNTDTVLKNFIIDSHGEDNIIGLQIGRGVYFNYVYNFDIRVYGKESIGIVETSNFNTILRDGRIIGRLEGYQENSIGIKFTTGTDSVFNNQVTNLKTDSVLIQGFDYGCLLDYVHGAHDTIMFSNIGFSLCNVGYYLKSSQTSVLVENQRVEFSNLLVKVDQTRSLTLKDLYVLDSGCIEQKSGAVCMLGSVYLIKTNTDLKKRAFLVESTAQLSFNVSCYDNWGLGLEDEIAENSIIRFGKKYSSIGDALNNLGSTYFNGNIPTISKTSTLRQKLALNISANDYWVNSRNTTLDVGSSTNCIKLGVNVFSIIGGVDGDKHLLTSDSDAYRDVVVDNHYFRINNNNFILIEKVNGVWKVISHNAISLGSTESFGLVEKIGIIVNLAGHFVDAFGRTGNVAIKGSDTDRPKSLVADDAGKEFFQNNIDCPIWWNGSKWVNALGFAPSLTKGTTELRPGFNVGEDEGFEYYDTTLKKKILWNGTDWVNMDGTELVATASNEQDV